MYMKNILILVAIILLIAAGTAFYLFNKDSIDSYVKEQPTETTDTTTEPDADTVLPTETTDDDLTNNSNNNDVKGPKSIIGKSVDGNDIVAYHFGDGEDEVLFIGGIHGGYSWNTALVAFEMIDWLESNPSAIPDNVTVTVIPVLNPDGLEKVTGTTGKFSSADVNTSTDVRTAGRFNANTVDLNRNFDCEWKSVGTWQNRSVSGGSAPFSEPESKAIRSYVAGNTPSAVVTWYSSAGGVYASNCKNGILPETLTLTNLYANAAGYPAHEDFNYYEITGDMVNWFAGQNVPAISVLLTSHDSTEWSKNRSGIEAILNHYAN